MDKIDAFLLFYLETYRWKYTYSSCVPMPEACSTLFLRPFNFAFLSMQQSQNEPD